MPSVQQSVVVWILSKRKLEASKRDSLLRAYGKALMEHFVGKGRDHREGVELFYFRSDPLRHRLIDLRKDAVLP